jgi:hypothetical protein
MIEEIKESIKVKAVFADGLLKPEAFMWRKRAYAVKDIFGAHESRQGRSRRFHYAVGCGGEDVYELALDTEHMEWRLDRVHTPG